MADINFDCPHCGHNLDVNERGAGLTVACPECSKNIEIPVPEHLMSNIKFTCGSCRQSLEALPDMVGQLVECPACKKPTEIPFTSRPADKALVCEWCGKRSVKKVGGKYVCDNCGTKYSIENAKKMMVEMSRRPVKLETSNGVAKVCEWCGRSSVTKAGNEYVCNSCKTTYSIENAKNMMDDTSGSPLIVDTSDEVAKLYIIARRAYKDLNEENAAKYYEMILLKDPRSWEAQFYVVFYQARNGKIEEIERDAFRVLNCIETVLALIKDNYNNPYDRYKCVNHMAARVIEIEALLYSAEEAYFKQFFCGMDTQDQYIQIHVDKVFAIHGALYTSGDLVESIFADDPKICGIAPFLWRAGIPRHATVVKYIKEKDKNIAKIINYANKVKKYHPEYKIPAWCEISAISTSSEADGGPAVSFGNLIVFCLLGVVVFIIMIIGVALSLSST